MLRATLLSVALAALIAGCEGAKVEHDYPDPRNRKTTGSDGSSYANKTSGQSIFGKDGLSISSNFGGDGDTGQSGGGIGVNAYLWRATLDTLAFMPLSSADPFGGVIITDWHALPESPDERFKMSVYILGRQLRSDGLRVSVFRQSRKGEADWVDTAVAGNTASEIENRILTRARELRVRGL